MRAAILAYFPELRLIHKEGLLWATMRRLECLAAMQYERCAPELFRSNKRALVDHLLRAHASLSGSVLSQPLESLCVASMCGSRKETIMVQGVALEAFGLSVYRLISRTPDLAISSRTLAATGAKVTRDTMVLAADILDSEWESGERLFSHFRVAVRPVLRNVRQLGLVLDEELGQLFRFRFSAVTDEMHTVLAPLCIDRFGFPEAAFTNFLEESLGPLNGNKESA